MELASFLRLRPELTPYHLTVFWGPKAIPIQEEKEEKSPIRLAFPISNQVLREFVWCSEAAHKKKGSMVKSQKLPRNEGDHNTRKWKGEKLRA